MADLTLEQYCHQKRLAAPKEGNGEVKKHPCEITKRWSERVVAQGLHLKGLQGAVEYLERYGRGIQAPKCVSFALLAESEGFPEMAKGFWERAFALETGAQPVKA